MDRFRLVFVWGVSVILFLNSGNVDAQDPNFYIYLCFGQSNMEGQGTIEQVDKTVDNRFQVLQAVGCSNLGRVKGQWYPAVPPLTRCWNGLSPADYFGRTMADTLPDSIRIGVVNVSVGGCRIELFDKDIYQNYLDGEQWYTDIIAEYDGNPYGYLVELAQLAQQDGVIKGILLHQGESNTGDSQWPAKVKKVYDDLISDLGLPDTIPLLAGEVVHEDQDGVCASMNDIIDKLPETIPNSYVIPSSGCTDKADNIHFNSAGYRKLGIRYAIQMLSLMGIEITEPEDPGETGGIKDQRVANEALLDQNYPNPFTGNTRISFSLPDRTFVSLKVYDILGQVFVELCGKEYPGGIHHVEFCNGHLPPGLYLYTLKTREFTATRRMSLIADQPSP